MADYSGELQSVVLSRTLWVVVAVPLLGAAMNVVLAWRGASAKAAARVGVVATAAALVATLAHAGLLAASAPSERFLLDHAWRLVRIGQLDVDIDLALDPVSAIACVVVASVAVVSAAATRGVAPARVACRELLVAMTLLVILADGFVVALAAMQMATLACVGLAKEERRLRIFAGALVADAPFTVGAAMIFWGLGGGWASGGYTPDLSPRFVAVHAPDSSERAQARRPRRDDDDDDDVPRAAPGDGLLTLTALPGAIVFVDEARTPISVDDRPLRAPFVRHPIRNGLRTFRVHGGRGVDDYVVSRVLVDGGRETTLALAGPTMAYRQIRDQLGYRPAVGGGGPRDALAHRSIGGVPVVNLACVLLFVGIVARLARVGGASLDEGRGALASLVAAIGAATAAAHLVVRLAPLLAMSQEARAFAACGALAFALGAAISAACARDARALSRIAVAQGASALAAIALGAPAAGFALLVVAALALSAMHVVLSSAPRSRARAVACAALAAAPAPFVGASWPAASLAIAAYGARASPVPGVVVAALVVAAFGACAFAASRVATDRHPSADDARASRSASTLAVLAMLAGPILSASRHVFGESDDAALQSWLAPVFAHPRPRVGDVGATAEMLIAAIVFGAALLGWSAGKRGGARARDAASGWQTSVARALRLLGAFAASLDRWVIDAVGHAVVGATRAGAWMSARADADLVGAVLVRPASSLARASARAERLRELGPPLRVLAVGAVAAVVLYSLLASR